MRIDMYAPVMGLDKDPTFAPFLSTLDTINDPCDDLEKLQARKAAGETGLDAAIAQAGRQCRFLIRAEMLEFQDQQRATQPQRAEPPAREPVAPDPAPEPAPRRPLPERNDLKPAPRREVIDIY